MLWTFGKGQFLGHRYFGSKRVETEYWVTDLSVLYVSKLYILVQKVNFSDGEWSVFGDFGSLLLSHKPLRNFWSRTPMAGLYAVGMPCVLESARLI